MKKKIYQSFLVCVLLIGCEPAYSKSNEASFFNATKLMNAGVVHLPPKFDGRLDHIMEMVSAGASGGGVGDFDKDGYIDIFVNVPRRGEKNALLRNIGGEKFVNVIDEAGLSDINNDNQVATMGLFLDYDGDGWQDLLIPRFGSVKLFKNNKDGTFKDVSKAAGFSQPMNALTAVAFDYDRDGDIDVYVGNYFRDIDMFNLEMNEKNILHDSWETSTNGGSNVFYRNNGDGTFSDVTEKVGLFDTGWTMALAHGDLNNDGWQDLYVANDYGTDRVFINDRAGKFIDRSNQSIGQDTKKGMNAELGDFDNDGDLDVFVTNVTEEFLYECNMLWQNDGKGVFVDVSQELGVCDTGWGWGGKFFDHDNDGWQDLYVANGFFSGTRNADYLDALLPAIWESGENPADPEAWPPLEGAGLAASEKNVFYRNIAGRFSEVESSIMSLPVDSRAVITADFNNDGKIDVYVTNNNSESFIFINKSNAGNWLGINLMGKSPNTDAVGARVYINTGKRQQMREVNIGNGFASGSSTRQHFGLGDKSLIDKVEIHWPSGIKHTYENVKANRIIHVNEESRGIK